MALEGAATGKNASSTFDAFERCLEVVDVALELGRAGILDRRRRRRRPAAVTFDQLRSVAAFQLGIKFVEALAVGASREGIRRPARRAAIQSR